MKNFWKSFDVHKIKDFAKRNSGGIIAGGGGGALLGAYEAHDHNKNKKNKKDKVSVGKSALIGAGVGAGVGAAAQHFARKKLQEAHRQYNYGGSSGRSHARASVHNLADSQGVLGLSGKESTKAEVKSKFREMAMKHHPDRGGSDERMKELNRHWDSIQESGWFQKLAFLKGFEKRSKELL